MSADVFAELSPPYSTIVVDPPWPYDDNPLPDFSDGRLSRFLPYETMSLAALGGLPLASLAAPGAHLYVWTTQRFLWAGKDLLEGWGWSHRKLLTWCKEPMGRGPGGAFSNTTEFILFARSPVGGLIRSARLAAGHSQSDVERSVRGAVTRLSKRWEDDDCFPTPRDWDGLRSFLPGLAGLPDIAADPRPMNTTWWRWKRGAHSAKPAGFLDVVQTVSPGPYVDLFSREPRLGWDSWGHGYELGVTA